MAAAIQPKTWVVSKKIGEIGRKTWFALAASFSTRPVLECKKSRKSPCDDSPDIRCPSREPGRSRESVERSRARAMKLGLIDRKEKMSSNEQLWFRT
ncbi:hypothetical protein GOBAR_DD09494 [Gossypium barbadense]|nr:hypothetical protein GOBAR_DD09494 [Gossypium barbadense]